VTKLSVFVHFVRRYEISSVLRPYQRVLITLDGMISILRKKHGVKDLASRIREVGEEAVAL
jgi:hypothetical protein